MTSSSSIPNSRQISMSRDAIKRTLTSRYADQARLQEEMATGQKIRRASDDPTGYGIARRLDSVVSQYDQYLRSIQAASVWTDNAQDSLDQMSELLTQAYEEGIRGANDTMGDTEREIIADRVDRIAEELLDRLNEKTADGYIFAGSDTQTRPFVDDSSTSADGAGITYYGNSTAVSRVVGVDSRMVVGIPGSRVIDSGSGTITESLSNLSTALRANDASAVETALADVITARDHTINLGSEVGVTAERMSLLSERLQSMSLRVQEQRSGIEDADLAATVVELQKSQTGLQAALQAVASIYQNTILNYLR